jgi:CHRD domain
MRKRRAGAFSVCVALAMVAMVSTTTQAQQVVLSGNGSGAFEATAAGPQNNGAVASAQCTFDRNAQTIACSSQVFNIVDLIAAHIHIGGPGTSGPVIIPIPNLPLHISGSWGQTWTWSTSDVITNPGAGIRSFDELLQACVAGNCYLNWHTTASPGGALRVNLCPKSAAANTVNGIAVCVQ